MLAAEAGEVIIALRLRSDTRVGRKSIIRHLPYIAKPLLARCFRRSQTLALSVVSRGFFIATTRKEELWHTKEKFVCCLLIIFTIGITFSKIVYLLSEQGLYFGNLRIVYDWTNYIYEQNKKYDCNCHFNNFGV